MVEGFEYKSYPVEIVEQVLNRYLADRTLLQLSLEIGGVSHAGAQRIVDEAVRRGVLSKEDKHKAGGGFAKKRAMKALEKYPERGPGEIARIAECSEATVYRARKSK